MSKTTKVLNLIRDLFEDAYFDIESAIGKDTLKALKASDIKKDMVKGLPAISFNIGVGLSGNKGKVTHIKVMKRDDKFDIKLYYKPEDKSEYRFLQNIDPHDFLMGIMKRKSI